MSRGDGNGGSRLEFPDGNRVWTQRPRGGHSGGIIGLRGPKNLTKLT